MSRRISWVVVAGVLAVGCAEPARLEVEGLQNQETIEPTAKPSSPSIPLPDAGDEDDAGSAQDGGQSSSDGGTKTDAGTKADGGSGSDGGSKPDAGQTDAGHSDAGQPDSGTVGPTACQAFEPNNSIATAAQLASGTYNNLGICSATDLDIYKIDVPAESVVTVTVSFNHAQSDLDVFLSNGTLDAQNQITTYASSDSDSYSEEQILFEPHASAMTSYIIVRGYNGAQGNYAMTVDVSPGVAGRDCFHDCADMVQLTGAASWNSSTAKTNGHFIYTQSQYAYGRRELIGLIKYATLAVKTQFPATTNDPVAISDICQSDKLTPGTDMGSPRHPTTTHINGNDVDIAYYQDDGASNYQIICGDGSDTNGNGSGGTWNDGQFCTTDTNVVDVPRQVYFLAKLAESPNFRVVGIDQTLATPFKNEAQSLYNSGVIGIRQFRRITEGLGYGAAGGWQYHHHHIHLSLYE